MHHNSGVLAFFYANSDGPLWIFPQGMSSEFESLLEIPYAMHPLEKVSNLRLPKLPFGIADRVFGHFRFSEEKGSPNLPIPAAIYRSSFRAWAEKCPTECFLSVFGHSEPGAEKHSKSTPWALSGPVPKSTPVNGGQDRNPNPKLF